MSKSKRTEIRSYNASQYIEYFGHLSAKILQFSNVANGLAYLLAKKQTVKEHEKRDLDNLYASIGLERGERAIKIGYIVKELYHKMDKNKAKDNIVAEVWISESDLRQHIQVAGTTGSGKTVWIKAVLEQQIARGGGAFVVFGKADNKMLQQMHYAAAKYGREQDLFVIDWTATPEDLELAKSKYDKDVITNSINFFELGDEDAVIATFLKIAGIDEKDSWGAAAKSLLEELLKFLYKLEKIGLVFDIDKIDYILSTENKIEAIKRHRETLNYYFLREMITDKKALFKLLAIFDEVYRSNRDEIIERLKIGKIDYIKMTDEKYRIDKDLIAALKQQTKHDVDSIIASVRQDKNAGVIDAIEAKSQGKQSPFYKLDVSISQYNKILSFYNRFSLVLKNRYSDVDLIDAIKTNKIIVFNLPGQSEDDAIKISDFFMSLIQTIIKKRGKQEKFEVSYLLVLDEINSWAARNEGSIGIGNILSVVRGLGIGVLLAYQSSLEGLDKEKKEQEQINSNVNTTILLKTESNPVREYFNEKIKKEEKIYIEEKLRGDSKNGGDEIAATAEKEDFFKPGMLQELKPGEGYLVRNGTAYPFIAEYLGEDRFYKLDDEPIDLAKTIPLGALENEIAK